MGTISSEPVNGSPPDVATILDQVLAQLQLIRDQLQRIEVRLALTPLPRDWRLVP